MKALPCLEYIGSQRQVNVRLSACCTFKAEITSSRHQYHNCFTVVLYHDNLHTCS